MKKRPWFWKRARRRLWKVLKRERERKNDAIVRKSAILLKYSITSIKDMLRVLVDYWVYQGHDWFLSIWEHLTLSSQDTLLSRHIPITGHKGCTVCCLSSTVVMSLWYLVTVIFKLKLFWVYPLDFLKKEINTEWQKEGKKGLGSGHYRTS